MGGVVMESFKVLDLTADGKSFFCVYTKGDKNPYRLYRKWWNNGWHRKQVARYANFASVLFWLTDYSESNHWGYRDGGDAVSG